MLQALNSVAAEAEEPTSVEFARIINETRVGREVGHALDETARRMNSDDSSGHPGDRNQPGGGWEPC
jgi:tight adherence protein B